MSIIAREKKPKGGGQSPQFKMRIDPALKEQLDAVAAEEGVSLASWFKELARSALKAKSVAYTFKHSFRLPGSHKTRNVI